MEINPIAYIHTDFPAKFGIPRQAGIVPELTGTVSFEPKYSQPEAVRGLSGFSHIWLIWDFSLEHHDHFNLTVKPPRLGGRESVGVFASRSPFRPNSLGLSSVRLTGIEYTDKGPVLHVSGVDMVDGTPIYDIKPYIPYDDCHTDASGGYTDSVSWEPLTVSDPEHIIDRSDLSAAQKTALFKILSQDPRSRFDSTSDGSRRYGFFFSEYDVRFTVKEKELTVVEMVKC